MDTTTFGYVAMFSALIVYLGGGMLGSYRGQRAGARLPDIIIWLALGFGIVMLYIYKDDLMPIGARFLRRCPHASQP